MQDNLTREVPLVPAQSAILFIDVQNFSARRDGGEPLGRRPQHQGLGRAR